MPAAMTPYLVIPLATLLLPMAASAHAILVDSAPAIHASIPAGHQAMTLRFNSRIDRERSRLTLVASDKTETRLPIGKDGAADTMTTSSELAPGDYTVRWQVLAVDGHITRGDVPFTVVAAP